MLLFAGIIVTVTVLVFVIVAYHRHNLHRNQETSQGSSHVSCVYSLHVVLLRTVTVVYEEPYDWAVSRPPQTEPVIEQCPAYGVLTKFNDKICYIPIV